MRQDGPFYPGKPGDLVCYPYQHNQRIEWYKNNQLLKSQDLAKLNAQLNSDRTRLRFFNVTSRLHNGLYACENTLNNNQTFMSINPISLIVNETSPEKPFNTNVLKLSDKNDEGIIITWSYDPFCLPVKCIHLFWRDDPDSEQDEYLRNCSAPSIRSGTFIVMQKFTCYTIFRFQLENEIGRSELSDEFEFGAAHCKTDGKYINLLLFHLNWNF